MPTSTMWAKIVLDKKMAASLKGQLLVLVMHRPADDVKVTYPLRLKGGTEGFSNMISATDACVEAEAYFVEGTGRGPVAKTVCTSHIS